MDALFSASLIASFLAGMAALFAPCCITVLLPSYLASAFRERRNLLAMTFVFFAGISLVLMPIALGAAALAAFFRSFHEELYLLGGSFMVFLGVMALLGKGLTMFPMSKRTGSADTKSVFLLGVFSGAATSCCAPVLAGAVTLAVVSGTFLKALGVSFAYVLGLVFPLFLSALLYDHFRLDKSRIVQGKVLNIKGFRVHSTNLVSGLMFLAIGGVLIWLAFSQNAFWAPEVQGELGQALSGLSVQMVSFLGKIPNLVWAFVLFGGAGWLWVSQRRYKKTNNNEK